MMSDVEGLVTFKWTKAHTAESAVAQGLTTAWERKGNEHADYYAKQGALQPLLDAKARPSEDAVGAE